MEKLTGSFDCPACHLPVNGRFCSNCGEKRLSPDDHTIRHFIEESIEGLTHFDNRFLRSFRALFTKPGELAVQFERGCKKRFMKPVQLFIVSNILFFLASGGLNVFAISLDNYMGYNALERAFHQRFTNKAHLREIRLLFDERVLAQSKAFIFLFIPFIALACALLFIKKKKYFSLHLVFATHFFSFLLFCFTIFHFLVELPNRWFFHLSHDQFEVVAVGFNMTVLCVYFAVAAHRFYKTGWILTIVSSVAIGLLFLQLLVLYRLFLFYKILYSIH